MTAPAAASARLLQAVTKSPSRVKLNAPLEKRFLSERGLQAFNLRPRTNRKGSFHLGLFTILCSAEYNGAITRVDRQG